MSNNGPSSNYTSYPKPQADYQQIIQSPDFFLQNLRDFHAFYGTKFRVPTVGGSSLDLHRLFLEVTSRGGIEKLIKDRRWKEVIAAFNFPSSLTSASFALRKYYLSSLYHFEQVYYFRKEEPTFFAAGQTLSYADDDGAATKNVSANSKLGDGSLVSGTIDAKFEDGYLVTVNLGSEVLKGVLYHTPLESDVYKSLSTYEEPAHVNRKKNHKDPAHPKRNRSGYTFFFAEQYQILRPSYHGQERAISKRIGHLWSNLTESEKQVYQEKGLRDKERYKAEMMEYKSSHQIQG